MLELLFFDFLLGLLLLVIKSRVYTSSFAAPFTIYGGSALLGSSQVSWVFLLLYGLTIFIVNVLIGASLMILRNWLHSGTTLLEIFLIFLIPNLVVYIYNASQALQYISLLGNYTSYLGQLAIFIEHTAPLLVGGFIVWKLS